ncbi:hypothetical protein FDUTEX481_05923 [Tolypothrix sp. PCC 7601]|nr:hypothetical protein FDUTEX481_05923 [Tolypothrix sp. PCC 7601]
MLVADEQQKIAGLTQAKFVIATGTKCREAIPESQAITSLRS